MTEKNVPFTREFIEKMTEAYPTPFYIYDEKGMLENADYYYKAFDWVPRGFKNYFAVKALPNPYILKVLHKYGMGADCSSFAELVLAQRAGLQGEEIMFTSNDTPAAEYLKARELGAVINLDDISHIDFLKKTAGLPELISFRYNPGPLKKGNEFIGHPEEAKYGLTTDQIMDAYRICKEEGVKRFGLHTMVASNELDSEYFLETVVILFQIAVDLKEKLGIELEFINMGGGIGIPYNPEDDAVDLEKLSRKMKEAYDKTLVPAGLGNIRLVGECGRMVAGPYGYLVTRVRHMKHTYKDYVGTDACMANLMRPGVYGAYHHITVLGKEDQPNDHLYDVTGSLCENNDKFAIDRKLPEIERGDFLVLHDAGAHGHAMGFNYNGKLRSAEFLLRTDGSIVKIRRAETLDDYFATLDFSGLLEFS
ncbi:MAG: diaminopimelate decarboxylase [Spirochaetia bacterium]